MKKRKLSKVLVATTVFSSAFVASASVNAASSQSAKSLVEAAETNAVNLQTAFILLSQGKGNTLPWSEFNQTKKTYQNAKAAVSKLKGKDKSVYEARLQKVNVQVGRAAAIIDVVTSGMKLVEKAKQFEAKFNANGVNNDTVQSYHELSRYIKKQSILTQRVYDLTVQKALYELFQKAAEAAKDRALYPVSIQMQLDRAELALKENRLNDAAKYLSIAKTQMQDALNLGKIVQDSAIQKFLQDRTNNVSNAYYQATPSSSAPSTPPVDNTQKYFTAPGTYGPDTGITNIDGNVTISSGDVTLKNMVIHGDLTITEAVGDGNVNLENVTVTGNTYVKGGGDHSIHFNNSVLVTVIVNKNDGKIRIIASGSTSVVEVQLESYGTIEEDNLTATAPGFRDVTLNESVQTTDPNINVELLGSFETVNSRAAQARIDLAEGTDIQTLILNAAAAILGAGVINTAQINANGSTLSTMPQNLVLNNSEHRVTVGEQVVTENRSEAQNTSINKVQLTQSAISVNFNEFVAGITLGDFQVSATLEGQPITLNNLSYDAAFQRFTYTPIPVAGNEGKILKVTVAPSANTEKLNGESFESSTEIKTGFSGRITDIAKVGVPNAVIKFRAGANSTEGDVVGAVTTDNNGFYSVNLPAGEYTGEISGPGLITNYLYATAPSDVFNIDQNETAIRAAASNEIKIMLSWGESPHDLDSHLIGNLIDGTTFHTWYSDKVFEKNGLTYVDLDWDDTESYGPETTTIRKVVDGKYIFYTHNYSGEYPLDKSNAVVKVFKGNSQTPDQELTVPSGNDNALVWIGFELDISNNGNDVQITPINKLVPDEIDAQYYLNPREGIQSLIVPAQNLLGSSTDVQDENVAAARTLLQDKLNTANAVVGNTNATFDELYTAFTELSAAMNNLNQKLDDYYFGVKNPSSLYQDSDNNNTVSNGDSIAMEFTSDISNLDLPSTVGIALVDNGDEDLINIYNNTTDLTAENLLYSFTTSDIVSSNVAFNGGLNVIDSHHTTVTMENITPEIAASLKTSEGQIPLHLNGTLY